MFNQFELSMNNVKNVFSIKDLENLTGIKAHTIRIWEKRYNVLEPMRTESNIRFYDLPSLQKILNITLLHNHGYKISKISKLSEERIPELVNEIISDKSAKNHAISAFKMAMMNFDHTLFFTTYNNLLSEKTFREVFYEVFLPLMHEIGLLWQTDTISPAHEHFLSYLIKQKLLTNTEIVQTKTPTKTNKVFVLYLPMNEIHELGLMYLNYEILSLGYKTIYLGESIPTESLKFMQKSFDNITYICYTTVEPSKIEINSYIQKLYEEVVDDKSNLWLIGRMVENIDPRKLKEKTLIFNSIKEIVNHL